MRRQLSIALLGMLIASAAGAATEQVSGKGRFSFEFEELAPGVWAGVRPDPPGFPVMGNTTFVISDEGVVVFDGGGMPAMSEQLIAKIRSLTDAPVTHVITSHWHGDHNFGIYRFAEEYPGVRFIAHSFTRDMMNSSRLSYLDRQQNYVEKNLAEFRQIVETGRDADGNEVPDVERETYARIAADQELIDHEFSRARVTPPDTVFDDRYVIFSGEREIELLFLGHANTEGDIVMWLPGEKIVATGDIVVLPSPYAYNMPPLPWARTLGRLKELDYDILVPGHGPVQRDNDYVDLLIEAAESIAEQRDRLLADGMREADIPAALDFSALEERFIGDDDYLHTYFKAYFEDPFRAAAMKAVSGERMVEPPAPESVPFDDERWRIEAEEYELVDHLGQAALKIKGGEAWLGDTDIRNGLVEFDIAITPERGFAGLIFRARDELNYEHFYLRPHMSGNPDANQYTPVFGGISAWQLYHGPDFAVPLDYRFNEWMHVRMIYAGDQAEVYIDSDEPVLRIPKLRRDDRGGSIGVSSANFSAVHFANFRFTELADAYRFPKPETPEPAAQGTIREWQVSAPFTSLELEGEKGLTTGKPADHRWTTVVAEPTGLVNLAAVQPIEDGADTVFARTVVEGRKGRHKLLRFGYSDQARVYLNGKLIYQGDNSYMSRDYRYLGTIGLFDSVVLPLRQGENEIWVAVSEAFGGWGIVGQITDFE